MIQAPKTLQKPGVVVLRVVAGISLALALGMSVHQYHRLGQLQVELLARSPLGQAQDLQANVEKLERTLEHLSTQPPHAAQSEFELSQATFEQRITAIEDALRLQPSDADLERLRGRVHALESQATPSPRPSRPFRPARRPALHLPSQEAQPPFQIVGPELRGGHQFLTLLANGSHSIADVTLLRIGEAIGAWQLNRVTPDGAEFRVHGNTRILPLP